MTVKRKLCVWRALLMRSDDAGCRTFGRVFWGTSAWCAAQQAASLSYSFSRMNVFHYIHCALLIHRKPLVVWIALTRDTRTCHHEISLWFFHWDETLFQCHTMQFGSEERMEASERIVIIKTLKMLCIVRSLLTAGTNCYPLCIHSNMSIFHHIKTAIIRVLTTITI